MMRRMLDMRFGSVSFQRAKSRSAHFCVAPSPSADEITTSLERGAQPVPVVRRALAPLRVPERHHVRVADGVVDGLLRDAELHGVERIDAPAAQSGRDAIQASAAPSRSMPRRVRDDREPVQHAIDRTTAACSSRSRRGWCRRVKRGSDAQAMRKRRYSCSPVWCEAAAAWIVGVLRARAEGRRVAHGAVDANAREPDGHLRVPDRHLMPIATDDANRGQAARPGRCSGKIRGSTSQISTARPVPPRCRSIHKGSAPRRRRNAAAAPPGRSRLCATSPPTITSRTSAAITTRLRGTTAWSCVALRAARPRRAERLRHEERRSK